jgi:hypothetical protein
MTEAKTIKIEVGYEDGGTITFVDIDKGDIPLARKALTYLYKQEQEEKQKVRKLAPTCRNCEYSQQRERYDHTLCCSKRIVNKYYRKVVRPTETCELFERKEEQK